MRDVKRIPKVLRQIETFWEELPDLRFMQLISYLQSLHGTDMYYVEDESLIEFLEELIQKEEGE